MEPVGAVVAKIRHRLRNAIAEASRAKPKKGFTEKTVATSEQMSDSKESWSERRLTNNRLLKLN